MMFAGRYVPNLDQRKREWGFLLRNAILSGENI
jgi:ribosomal protein L34